MDRPSGLVDGSPSHDLPQDELDLGLEAAEPDLRRLAGARVLVTGGTGFLGSWLLASLLWANERAKLGMRVVALSRRPGGGGLSARPGLELVQADVAAPPPLGRIDFVVHGATSSVVTHGQGDGEAYRMTQTVVGGTRAVLKAAAGQGARLLYLSSGAIYGPQRGPVGEDRLSAPDPTDPRTVYAQAKRLAENLCAAATEAGEVNGVIARLFTFVGPRLPLNAHYAAGNFIRDLLRGGPVHVSGDGRPRRSYLYVGDLPEWCWALLARGIPGRAYNVGSPEAVSVAELAGRVAALAEPPVTVLVHGRPSEGPPPWYVPSTARVEEELALRPRTGLQEALRRSVAWFRAQSG